jgi:hypothetical protein
VKAGAAPLRVSSAEKVGNLNSDLLDGKDSTSFLASKGDLVLGYMATDARSMSAGLSFTFEVDGATTIHSTSSGDKAILLPLPVPTALFGTTFKPKKLTVCFRTSNAGASITSTHLFIRKVGEAVDVIADGTDRTATTEACYDTLPSQTVVVNGGLFTQLVLHFAAPTDIISIAFVKVTLTA